MHQLALVNPRRRRRKHAKRARAHRKSRRHVRRHRARRRSVIVVGRRVNPRRKHRIHHRRRRFSRRRNPRISLSGLSRVLIPAAIGGVGAVALDVGVGYLGQFAGANLPTFLTSGYGKVGLQVVTALGMGYAAKKVGISAEKVNAAVLGALTVAAYGLVKNIVKQAAPTVPGLSGGLADNIGAYMNPSLGYANPAPMVQGMGAYMAAGGQPMNGFGDYPGMSDGM